jgi:uncharacterized membrane protein YebE (DUF533 family)
MSRRKKNGLAGIVIGPVMIIVALVAIWKNETRYDFYREAAGTTAIQTLDAAASDQLISHSGSMDTSAQIPGKYLEVFEGFLIITRSSEIYAWERDEDDDGHVKWSKRWMSSVENNERNRGIRQELQSGRMLPDEYLVGELKVRSKSIEFVDPNVSIAISGLRLTPVARQLNLQKQGQNYLYLSKFSGDQIGDERVRYSGIPVPANATYFGKFSDGQGRAYDAHQRTGLINQLIQDSGVLHHIVAGDRETALATMKAYLSRLKWIVRGISTGVTVLGFLFLFGSVAKFLFPLPIIGPLAERGAWLLAFLIGIPVAMAAIVISYLASHPFWLAGGFASVGLVIYFLRRRGEQTKIALHKGLEQDFGRAIKNEDFEELEFQELVYLAQSDGEVGSEEKTFLLRWGKKHGWTPPESQKRIDQALSQRLTQPDLDASTEPHLRNLIRLSMADGNLTAFEMHTIRAAARKAGYDSAAITELMQEVRRSV